MSARTGIEWTEATWNPWMGCTQVSPGCAHCYMFREQRQYGQDPTIVRRSKTKFTEPLKWAEPRLVFTCSWSDWFHEGADAWRPEAWEIIRRTPHLTYQILTKRPERIRAHLPADWGAGYPNVWLGVSVENQRWADARIPLLLRTPAAVRFLSCEPLLGPVDLEGIPADADGDLWLDALRGRFCTKYSDDDDEPATARIAWVIAGGESGTRARPCELEWLRLLRDQCVAAGVAFFLKQLGGWPNKRGGDQAVLDGERWTQMPARCPA